VKLFKLIVLKCFHQSLTFSAFSSDSPPSSYKRQDIVILKFKKVRTVLNKRRLLTCVFV